MSFPSLKDQQSPLVCVYVCLCVSLCVCVCLIRLCKTC